MNRKTNMIGRNGLALMPILIVLMVIGLLAALVVPRLGNTDVVAIESNMKEDINNVKLAIEQGAALTIDKDFTGVTLAFLKTNKVLKDGFAERIDTNVSANGIYTAGYNSSITIAAKGDGNYDPVNGRFLMLIDYHTLVAEKKDILGPSVFGWLKKLAGNNQIACDAAAVTAYGAGTAVTMGTCDDATSKNGTFVVAF